MNEKIFGTFCDALTGETIVRELTKEEYEAYSVTISSMTSIDENNE